MVAEDNVALENAAPTAFGGERAFVFDGFAGVVEENARQSQIGVDFGINWQQRAAGPRHVRRVFEQAVAVGVVHRDGRRRPTKLITDFIEDRLHRRAQFWVADAGDETLEFHPEGGAIFRSHLDEVF